MELLRGTNRFPVRFRVPGIATDEVFIFHIPPWSPIENGRMESMFHNLRFVSWDNRSEELEYIPWTLFTQPEMPVGFIFAARTEGALARRAVDVLRRIVSVYGIRYK
ncbi:hypothetical protein D3C85_992080 [compost metagenome]